MFSIQAVDILLTKAREQLHIANHAEILESVRTDLELIRYVFTLESSRYILVENCDAPCAGKDT